MLKVEAAGSSKTLVTTYMAIQCCFPEDHNLNVHWCENLKYHYIHWILSVILLPQIFL
jgi:hypothetical protein